MATQTPLSISSVTYEDLADLEADFIDFDTDLLRIQAKKERALYARRAQIVRRIPHFWPLVLEQAPPEIDQYVQPFDSNVLLSALEELEVTRFEIGSEDTEDDGDPRSIAFRFTFAPNDVFEDRVLEKRFWQRTAPVKSSTAAKSKTAAPWTGLVSEPVPIRWKKGKDPTGGLLDLAVQVWKSGAAETGAETGATGSDADADQKAQNALRAQLDKTAMGGISFFAWFGYVGRRVSASESRAAEAEERAARAARAAGAAKRAEKEAANGGSADKDDEDDEEEEDDDDEDDEDDDDGAYPLEIFPDGDELAVLLAEDLWTNAIKYFRQAQEMDTLSDDDFESGAEDGDEPPPSKKQKK